MRGTARVRCPLVPLSTRPPGDGVVWRRTVHTQLVVLRSFTRQPETSPMQAVLHAAKMTTPPHTARLPKVLATQASASRVKADQFGSASERRALQVHSRTFGHTPRRAPDSRTAPTSPRRQLDGCVQGCPR